MPTSPNLLISPQEKAAVSDTQLSGLLPPAQPLGGGGSCCLQCPYISPLFLLRGGGVSATVGSTRYEMLPSWKSPPQLRFCLPPLLPQSSTCTWAHWRIRPSVSEIPGMCHPFAAKCSPNQLQGETRETQTGRQSQHVPTLAA